MNSPAEKDNEMEALLISITYLTLNTFGQLPTWFMYLIITAQLSNIKGFQLIPGEAAADQGLFYNVKENTFENRWSFSGKLLRELFQRRRPTLQACSPGSMQPEADQNKHY